MSKSVVLKPMLSFVIFLYSMTAFSQNFLLKGVVRDGDGRPIESVTIAAGRASTSSLTDGSYELQIPQDSTSVTFRAVGFLERRLPIPANGVLDVVMTSEENALDEVVVIGYGQQSRSTLTTSVNKVDVKEFENSPGQNPLLQLQGKVPGVSLQISNGQPGANPQIFIRGGSSTSPEGDTPLIIVDGVVGTMRNMSDLNPDDIETMQVLKDAASTAIYGARAANGVIIVKTKSGKAGKPIVNFKVTSALEQLARRYDFASARDYIHISRLNTHKFNKTNPDMFLSSGAYGMSTGNPRNSRNTLAFLDTYLQEYGQDYVAGLIENQGWETMVDPVTGKQLLFKETNYQDMTFQNGRSMQYDLNASGGTEQGNYYLGLGHNNQDGTVTGTSYKNYSALFNGEYNINEKIKVRSNVSYQVRESNAAWNYQNVLSRSITMPFTYRDYYEDGLPAPGEGPANFRSRHYEVHYKEKYNDLKVFRTTIGLGMDYHIIPGLKFSPSLYYNTTEGIENYFEASNETNRNRNARAVHEQFRKIQGDALLSYDKRISQHHINVLAGASYINDFAYHMSGTGYNAPTDYIPTLNATEPETQRITTTKLPDVIMSYFGRADYNFNAKYMLSASFRVDGSSRFAPNNRWGFFPGFSAGWNIHRENFWQPIAPIVSSLKLRSSWGQTGNNELSIADAQGQYAAGFPYDGAVGINNSVLANRNLVWETTTSFDIGTEWGFLRDRMQLTAEYYDKVTSDRLFMQPLWSSTGFSSIRSNFGSIRNSGVDLGISGQPIRRENFSWDLGFTFSYNRGTVVKLPENEEDKNRSGGNFVWDTKRNEYVKVGGVAEGERYGVRYAYQMIGVYARDEDAANAPEDVEANGRTKVGGDAIWYDKDRNGIIDYRDMVFMGYIRPDKQGGMINTVNYKGITARVVVDYAVGHVIDNSWKARVMGSARNNNMIINEVMSDKVWNEQGDIAEIPRYTVQSDADYNFRNHLRNSNGIGTSSGYGSNNSLYYSKGDYLAFRELSLSYELRGNWMSRAKLNGLRVTAAAFNLGYLTFYDGLSPEIFKGNDQGEYPRPRQFNLSLSATF
ncbi:SusC/RagA family TonB-linked outer membrane protein [Sphingobacterium olei]|uniref:SusC/RagA family TonB-linked outer membrane protein n=1 Tax=Sphingobacterium olei TaxID=2571155 RepID=A0A4U0NYM2_9SPHI|nr:SusC/RagA family TonB-linked outer membrane protein [Sphingobacterium olei]TJZ59915.1 SusC/RagA family TonB-linked outer membrane protein [Sphingobacterium olei]